MSGYNSFFSEQRRRAEEHLHYFDERSRSRSPPRRSFGMEAPSATIMLRGLSSSMSERDIRYALEDERANYNDLRVVRDRKSNRNIGFVEFPTVNDARQFMKDCRGELEVRKCIVKMNYSNPKERREDDRAPFYDSTPAGPRHGEEPSSTIMLRGIPSVIDCHDVRDVLDDDRVNYVDVRVIKDKNTGLARGFGFVEFASVHEAKRWMDCQKGLLRVRRHDLRLTYSAPRGPSENVGHFPNDAPLPGLLGPSTPNCLSEVCTGDWICSRCSSHNFRRRDHCFKCQLPRSQVQSLANSVDGIDLIGTTPCNTLILRCLDALTTEDDICRAFQDAADVKIRQCHVMRDEATHVSRCFAFAELPTVADAYKVMDIVTKEYKLFEIGGKAVTVSYAKNTFNTIMATLKTEGSYNAQVGSSRCNNSEISHSVTHPVHAPGLVAMNAVAASTLLNQPTPLPTSTDASACSSTGDRAQTYAASVNTLAACGQTLPPPSFPFNATTASSTTYPFPDTSKFVYDESTRFYYDPTTGLLYEPNTQYFYDRSSQQYFYWDQTRSMYCPVPQTAANASSSAPQNAPEQTAVESACDESEDGKSKDKDKKEKSAQQIAREMEKWAKKMNAQKKSSSTVPQRSDNVTNESSRTADTCYALLEAATGGSVLEEGPKDNTGLVAQYGGGDDSDDSGPSEAKTKDSSVNEAEVAVAQEEANMIDWAKLACLLCSRGFKDAATLQKHRGFSNLHIENLNKLRAKYGLSSTTVGVNTDSSTSTSQAATPSSGTGGPLTIASLMQLGAQAASHHAKSVAARQQVQSRPAGTQYRDRAKERRQKYGIPSPPRAVHVEPPPKILPPSKPIPVPMAMLSTAPPPPAAPNVGSRLMEKMGWQAGQGLGRINQGRTDIVEPEFREVGVGLGVKPSRRGPPSDNYKDNVKRAMFARYHELE